jgi:glycerol uptake facilitator-like aquaporin
VTNTSVNPARSIGPARVAGGLYTALFGQVEDVTSLQAATEA